MTPSEYLAMDEVWHLELLEAGAIWQDEHEADAKERTADAKAQAQ